MMRGSSQQFMGIPGPQKILKTVGSLWLSQTSNENANPGTSSSCPASEISCQANYHGQDTCCFNYPGGQMLQTQFWDVDPALGPEDAWTIHGLWPDHCNGGFDQFCDSRRKYSNISLILVDAGRGDLLEYMSEYWKDFRGDDSNLWQHEWNKHGTCVSTLEPDCYADYLPQQEVVDYFDKTVEVYKELPTHEFLANAGIIPSQTRTYALADIEAALEQAHGNPVTIRCRGGAINEIWYHFNIAGSLQSGEFVSAGPDGLKSNCPSRGIKYPLKHARHEPTHTTTIGHPEPTAPGIPFTGRGNLIVERLNRKHGCIISYGTWFSSGTCATFRAEKISDNIFTLKSSKGPCAFERDALACGPHVTTASEFTAKDGKLAYSDHTTFYADSPPKGRTQSNVYASQGGRPIEIEITWTSK
ncbi:Ribonuclease T2 [Penicillium camemberti]|uniref:Ribonuclease T2-like n=1 Tax=Penicillium camemberti (strain FM 013) TaxID=1429867 RepID=A0A0G4NYY6_PENC3|nr:Ribonuclease T2 [Penicillium camemberti]